MRIRFLLGPAGSGKTFRCLAGIRQALRAGPDGLPLVLLAPKQATFQLERQLLADPELPGYTRLHILSFERLAEFVFERLRRPVPELLPEEGRVMVLRALLEKNRARLQLFHATARLPGFARQLSLLLRELQQYHFDPARLETLAARFGENRLLHAKLQDFALLQRSYSEWLAQNNVEDADRLPDFACAALSAARAGAGAAGLLPPALKIQNSKFKIETLWLDGFAQMTPQERALLAAVVACSDEATLAFCLEAEPAAEVPWHSLWAPATETMLRCRDDLSRLPGASIHIETLKRDPVHNRFRDQPALQRLEENWGNPGAKLPETPPEIKVGAADPGRQAPVRLVVCANPEAEVQCAAREIRRLVRDRCLRYRDVAVLVRSLEPYHPSIRRLFPRYEIPFFLDRRESVAHHPLAELTRYALRVAAFGWKSEDWFGALKTGMVYSDDASLDRLENEALARGWSGKAFWTQPVSLPQDPDLGHGLERLRRSIVPPFEQLADNLAVAPPGPDGCRLAASLRAFWKSLQVDRHLEQWNEDARRQLPASQRHFLIQQTVWEQLIQWLKNLELAFPSESMPLEAWLPVVEAGLASLTVGVIPPAVDQVLVGTIDRSRNPDLRFACVLGLNETLFPLPPSTPTLLNRADRENLAGADAPLGPDYLRQFGLESYYGYIACTRAREALLLTHARRDADGRALNPSPFVETVRRLLPDLAVDEFSTDPDWIQAEHASELLLPALKNSAIADCLAPLGAGPLFQAVASRWNRVACSGPPEKLPLDLVEGVYGMDLRTSVSGLEDFAACPFKFLAGRGLRAEERLQFEIDSREKGSFQHEVLKQFHLQVRSQGKQWRDLSPAEARALVRRVGQELLPTFRQGLFTTSAARRFTAHLLLEGLERLSETLVLWARQYQFEPLAVEIGFGLRDSTLPPWRIDLDERHALLLRGRIDRVDVCPADGKGELLGVVIDYKSSARQLDPVLLQNGLELQLLAYLGALARFDNLDESVQTRIVPAGAFYVALRSGGGTARTRDAERNDRDRVRRDGWQHRGRFDGARLDRFDTPGKSKGDQFRYSLNRDGSFSARGCDALPAAAFRVLLAQVEEFLRQHGRNIFAGEVRVSPYRWRSETACDLCRFRPACRFDVWTQPFRTLRARPEPPPADPQRATGIHKAEP